MSHCDPVSHGTANSARKKRRRRRRECTEKINKGRRNRGGGGLKRQQRERGKKSSDKSSMEGWVSRVWGGGLKLPSARGSEGCYRRASSALVAGVPALSGW